MIHSLHMTNPLQKTTEKNLYQPAIPLLERAMPTSPQKGFQVNDCPCCQAMLSLLPSSKAGFPELKSAYSAGKVT